MNVKGRILTFMNLRKELITNSFLRVKGNAFIYAAEATALIKGKRYCKECKEEEYPNESVEFQDSDATFRCRARSCGADELSYYEWIVGSCCEAALNHKPDRFGNH